MNVLVVGSGAREHAITWKLRQSPRVDDLLVAPGNAGTAALATNLDIGPGDFEGMAAAVAEHDVGLTVVGPEAPLADGLADYFEERGLAAFGPNKRAARLESSKIFANDLMTRHGIPCARSRAFSDAEKAKEHISGAELPLVVKADGLAAGKGVTIAQTHEEAFQAVSDAMEARVFGDAGARVSIDEYLTGREVSLFAFTDGATVSPLVAACDYKAVHEGGRGPNTGGMGSYSPPEFLGRELTEQVQEEILAAIVRALASDGIVYRGALYGGLMITDEGPRVLEFNVRLGDPETQVILPRLETDLVDVMMASVQGKLHELDILWNDDACVAVVLASPGYPGSYPKGCTITGLDSVDDDVLVFHAGTAMNGSDVVTSGGRVLSVVGRGATLSEARASAYRNVEVVSFEGCQYRRDIADVPVSIESST